MNNLKTYNESLSINKHIPDYSKYIGEEWNNHLVLKTREYINDLSTIKGKTIKFLTIDGKKIVSKIDKVDYRAKVHTLNVYKNTYALDELVFLFISGDKKYEVKQNQDIKIEYTRRYTIEDPYGEEEWDE